MNLMVTRIADTGLDIPFLAVAVLVNGLGASRQPEVQRVGRLQRQKKDAVYYIFSDIPRKSHQARKRKEYMRSLGYDVEEMSYEFCVPDSDEIQETLYQVAAQMASDATDDDEDSMQPGSKIDFIKVPLPQPEGLAYSTSEEGHIHQALDELADVVAEKHIPEIDWAQVSEWLSRPVRIVFSETAYVKDTLISNAFCACAIRKVRHRLNFIIIEVIHRCALAGRPHCAQVIGYNLDKQVIVSEVPGQFTLQDVLDKRIRLESNQKLQILTQQLEMTRTLTSAGMTFNVLVPADLFLERTVDGVRLTLYNVMRLWFRVTRQYERQNKHRRSHVNRRLSYCFILQALLRRVCAAIYRPGAVEALRPTGEFRALNHQLNVLQGAQTPGYQAILEAILAFDRLYQSRKGGGTPRRRSCRGRWKETWRRTRRRSCRGKWSGKWRRSCRSGGVHEGGHAEVEGYMKEVMQKWRGT
ncbi:hypothetical protein C7M84_000357 [Penaeus vannamei]|uniref:ERCC3/RAD25/XPB helicase C-terminal domain-containing protein n=1 Tax=Penaeus vannamei TaxID=6689 RepID=A0A423TWP9_PENVA|nr:hypothetical protein C7M84_000357 [Penaeus vannamei]